MLDYLLFGANILIWNVLPFLTKMCMNMVSPQHMTILRYIYGGIIASLILLFNYKKNLQLFSYKKYLYLIIFLLALGSYIATHIYFYILSKYDANFVNIIINPLGILLTAFIGTVFFKEIITKQMWAGIFMIVSGLLVFFYGKNK